MSKASQPELKKFMDKKLFIHLQAGRKVSGVLRGYDLFLNLVIDDALEETTPAQKHPIGTVVIRGNSVTSMETLESVRCLSTTVRNTINRRSHLNPGNVHFFSKNFLKPQLFGAVLDLESALESRPDPSKIWDVYANARLSLGVIPLSLELHQKVLRCCTVPLAEMRSAQVKKTPKGDTIPTVHEQRLKAMLTNIQNDGYQPALEDYHFVLGRLAALGSYDSCFKIYGELKRIGHTPTPTTLDICLYSIAHRFSLSFPSEFHPGVVQDMQVTFRNLMDDMQKFAIVMTGPILDSILRILKETANREAFESILRWGFAVDMSFPDRVPLEYTESHNGSAMVPFRLTTSALNTIIDMYGRLGDISKMVQAFEVLTQPLPNASQHFFDAFDSDEEGDFGDPVDVLNEASFPLPTAAPNTTTYYLLLLHLSRLGHLVLARHYIVQARSLDRQIAWRLKYLVTIRNERSRSFLDIPAPRLALDGRMLFPAVATSNRRKDLGFMKWLFPKVGYLIRRKTEDLTFFEPIFRHMQQIGSYIPQQNPDYEPTRTESSRDLEIYKIPRGKINVKRFDIGLQVRTLKRNLKGLHRLHRRLEFLIGRTTQRLKEHLGRRVWAGKDVYFSLDGKRVITTKDHWRRAVNFKPRMDRFTQKDSRKWSYKYYTRHRFPEIATSNHATSA